MMVGRSQCLDNVPVIKGAILNERAKKRSFVKMVGEFELELAGNNLESVPLCNGTQKCLNSYVSKCVCVANL